jgi:uncharacterized protein YbaR (Trm112 family)
VHVALTDAVVCPKCGPQWGLILLADKTEQRRIQDGMFACANCRSRFPVKNGFCDLRLESATAPSHAAAASSDEALRIAAALGVTQGPALLMIVGDGAVNAATVAAMIEAVEVVAVSDAMAEQPEQPGVSRFATDGTLPFRSGSMRGIALTGKPVAKLITGAARVVAPRGRVALMGGDDAGMELMTQSGLRIVAHDAIAIVAERTTI